MSIVTNVSYGGKPNFLESEVGLVLKTHEIPASLGTQEGKYKTVKAGTPFPSNDANAIGFVFEDIDVTDGNMPGSVMVAGRVLADRLTVASAAKTALSNKGIVFVDAPEITRGFTLTYNKNDGTGTPPVDENEYFAGSIAKVSTEYPLTKTSNKQVGWSTEKGGSAVETVEMTGNITLYPVWQAT